MVKHQRVPTFDDNSDDGGASADIEQSTRSANRKKKGSKAGSRAIRGDGDAAELRAWLLVSAKIPTGRVDALMTALAAQWVEDVQALRNSLSVLEEHLPAAAYSSIQKAVREEKAAPSKKKKPKGSTKKTAAAASSTKVEARKPTDVLMLLMLFGATLVFGSRTVKGMLGKSDTCTPGCPHGHPDAAWCQTRHDSQCGWHPERLDQMLMQQFEQGKGSYNELILGGDAWEDNLPHTVMAVFWPKYASYDQQQHARGVHQDFLRHYGLKWQQVPLVVYDPHAESEAFTLAARR